jgi:hypothetical protein
LRKRTAAMRFEVGVEVAARSRASDEAVACSEAGMKDGRWQRWCDSFWGDDRARENTGMKIC